VRTYLQSFILLIIPNHLQTFGCTHYQQVIWEVFDHIITGWVASGDTNTTFLRTVKATQEKMDKGIHIGGWGQIQGN
jgi:alpha-L-fucosidase 2